MRKLNIFKYVTVVANRSTKNPKHPSLGTHTIVNTPYREFRVDIQHRVVFRSHEEGTILLDIGPHDVIDTWRRRR